MLNALYKTLALSTAAGQSALIDHANGKKTFRGS